MTARILDIVWNPNMYFSYRYKLILLSIQINFFPIWSFFRKWRSILLPLASNFANQSEFKVTLKIFCHFFFYSCPLWIFIFLWFFCSDFFINCSCTWNRSTISLSSFYLWIRCSIWVWIYFIGNKKSIDSHAINLNVNIYIKNFFIYLYN